mmetsp:Transcript_22817/g.63745  ORF Transcript_22817/g.63745 Transcript_22817/m.63745 type:complete len:172 (-) Transcript_22817:166-681(-)
MGNAANCQAACKADCKEIQQYCEQEDTEDGKLEEVNLAGLLQRSALDNKEQADSASTGAPTGPLADPSFRPRVVENRQRQFTVEIVRIGEYWRTLGLLVSPDDDPRYLIVDDVWEPSLISEWNAKCSDNQKVRPGDIMVSVNDIRNSGEKMLGKIQALGLGSTVRLQFHSA